MVLAMSEMELGTQPLDRVLEEWGLSNHDLVEVSPEQLSHKQVGKARKGRRLTLHMMQKIARTVNFAIWGRLTNEEREEYEEYFPKHLFNYSKNWAEENVEFNAGVRRKIGDRKLRKDFLEELGKVDE